MKKTTLLIACMLLSAKMLAQVTPYTTASSLESNFNGTLVTENFDGGFDFPLTCGEAVSSEASDCFDGSVLVEGFEITASQGQIVFLPAGFLPSDNTTPRLGANTGIEYTIISFTGEEDVYAVGHSLHVDNNANFNYRVFNRDEELIYEEAVDFTPYFGVISTTPIGRIEIENVNNAGELIGDLSFGTTTLGLDYNQLRTFTYPNPVNDVLNIQSVAAVASVKVINMLGQVVLSNNVNATTAAINITALTQGNYIVEAAFANGATQTFRIVKK